MRHYYKYVHVLYVSFSIWFVGIRQINPFSTSWIPGSDLKYDFYVYQEFFLRQSIFSFPLSGAKLLSIAEPKGSTLFLFPFKVLAPIFENRQFQVIGLYLLANLIAHGFFSSQLLKLFNLSKAQHFCGVIILYAPILFHRMTTQGHVELSSHYVLLAAFFLYFKKTYARRSWLILIVWCGFLNVYLAVMVSVIYLAHLFLYLQQLRRKNSSLLVLVTDVALVSSGLAIIFGLQGYFSLDTPAASTWGRLNLLAFLIPNVASFGTYSRLIGSFDAIQNRPFFSQEGEGFAYLGLGAVILLVIFLFTYKSWINVVRRHSALIFLLFAMFTFSLSPSIVFARRQIIEFDPGAFRVFWGVFHSPERFSIPLYYFAVLSAVVTVGRWRKSLVGSVILLVLTAVQLVDIGPGVIANRDEIRRYGAPIEMDVISVSDWTRTLRHFSEVQLFPIYDFNSDIQFPGADLWTTNQSWFGPVVGSAIAHRRTNFAYLSRTNSWLQQRNAILKNRLERCSIDNEIFVLLDDYINNFKPNIGANCRIVKRGKYSVIVHLNSVSFVNLLRKP